MRAIYSKAEEVIIWLGPSSDNIDLLMGLMNRVHSNAMVATQSWAESPERWQVGWPILQHRLRGIHHTEIDTRVGDAFQELFQKPWFLRVWVIQEVASARAASIMCGSNTISTRTFTQIPPLLGMETSAHTQAVLDVMPGYLRKSTWWSHKQDLATLLQKFQHSKAGDPRDKIYALLGISSDACSNEIFRPNYERSSNQVARDTMRLLLFGTQTIAMGETDDRECQLPAWTVHKLLEHVASLAHDVLVWAIKGRAVETIRQLLESRKLEVDRSFLASATLFCYVTDRGRHAEFIRAVLAGEDVYEDLHHYSTESSNERRDAIVQLIQELKGIDVNLGQLLAKAAKMMDHTMTELLLTHKNIDVNLGQPLAGTTKVKSNVIMKLLLGHKDIDVNLGQPLAKVVSQGDDIAVNLLLAHKNIDANLGQPLVEATKRGYYSTAKLLLAHKNIDVNLGQPLVAATKGEDNIIMKLLLGHKDIDVNLGQPLAEAASQGDDTKVGLLLAHKNIDATLGQPLTRAAAKNFDSTVKLLLSDSNTDLDLDSPLSIAAEMGHYIIVRRLLAHDNAHTTELWDCVAIVMVLLSHKDVDTIVQDIFDGPTKLVSKSLVNMLRSISADVDTRDETGRTLLSKVAESGSRLTTTLLLKKGANVHSRDDGGRTSLSWAASNGNDDGNRVIQCLLEEHADIESRDNNGRTPLSWAAGEGRSQVVQCLIKKGANLDCQDNSGRTPLTWAFSGNHSAVLSHLLIRKLLVKSGVI